MNPLEQLIANVRKWKTSAGKTRYLKYLTGEKLSYKQAITAKCAECRNGFEDGLGTDCGIQTCPLYPFSPWSLKPADKRAVKPRSLPVRHAGEAPGATEPPEEEAQP